MNVIGKASVRAAVNLPLPSPKMHEATKTISGAQYKKTKTANIFYKQCIGRNIMQYKNNIQKQQFQKKVLKIRKISAL